MKQKKWCSVKTKLPKFYEAVLLFCERDYDCCNPIVIGYRERPSRLVSHEFGDEENPVVTHWMPLPEPPAKEKK